MYVYWVDIHRGQALTGIADASEQDIYAADISSPDTPRILEGQAPAAANAAVALAQLHDWTSDFVSTLELRISTSKCPDDLLLSFPTGRLFGCRCEERILFL